MGELTEGTTLKATQHCAKIKCMRISPGTQRQRCGVFLFHIAPLYRDLENSLYLNNLKKEPPYFFNSVILN